MPTVTLSSKHQVTLPVDMVRTLGLKSGDKLVAELVDDHIVLLPQPESWADYFIGSMKGVYGSTLEEIDRYIADERRSLERDEWRERFYDLIARNPDSEKIVASLRKRSNLAAPEPELLRIDGVDPKRAAEALRELVRHGGVRKIPPPPGIGAYEWQYRLVREFAEQ